MKTRLRNLIIDYNLFLMTTMSISHVYLRKHIALPGDHGSWIFVLSPLLIGLAAGRQISWASVYLIVAVMAAFLIRQPTTIAIKAYAGRRSKRDLPVARFWIVIYGVIALLALLGLVLAGLSYILILALPGIPVFIWHLYLVSRRAERRQIGVEVIGSGVLALAAPAAYWVGVGEANPTGWWLFGLTWLQSAASIVYAYLRLEQRELNSLPSTRSRLQMARRALLYTTFNLSAVSFLSVYGVLPTLLPLAYLLQWLECIWGTYNPAIGVKPTSIGFRQLAVSIAFTIIFILTWNYT